MPVRLLNLLNPFAKRSGPVSPEETIRLASLHPTDSTVKTNEKAPAVIAGTDRPAAGKAISADRITLPGVEALSVEKVAADAGVSQPTRWPDFTVGVLKIAAARERFGADKLKALSEQVKEQLGDIDILLDINSELTALPDKDSHDVSDKMRTLIAKLEIHKIQIWKGGDKISKEKLSEFKAQISSQIDKLRTSMQTTISTEIQPEANNLQAIMNIVQRIVQLDAGLKKKACELRR